MRVRPEVLVRHELETAVYLQESYAGTVGASEWIAKMREQNEREIESLRIELSELLSADLEISVSGEVVQQHTIAVPYLNRLLTALQGAYRTVAQSVADSLVRRSQTNLALSGTGPGSFVLQLQVPAEQLQFDTPPLSDRSMDVIVGLLGEAADPAGHQPGHEWALSADEPQIRSMIRLASALSASKGTTRIRWRPASAGEQVFALSSEAARSLAISLAGDTGREIVEVIGHLEMASDQPPRVRVTNPTDSFLASVPEEMLEAIKQLLFSDVRATLAIDSRTSVTTGALDIRNELIDIEAHATTPSGS